MKLLVFLFHTFRSSLLMALLISALSGLANTGLVALASRRLTNSDSLPSGFLVIFTALLALAITLDFAAKWLLTRLTGKSTNHLRITLVQQILNTPYTRVEQIGPARLNALLTEDVHVISQVVSSLPMLFVSLATLTGCLLYLGWLSPLTLVALGVLILPTIVGYRFLHRRATSQIKLAMRTRNQLFDHYRSLIEGIKELMLHRERQHSFFQHLLQPTAEKLMQQTISARTWHQAAQSWSQSVYFFFILGIFAIAELRQLDLGLMTTYALVVLYMKSSMLSLLQTLSFWSDATIALQQVELLGFSLQQGTSLVAHKRPVENEQSVCIQLTDLMYRYKQDEEQTFVLGPINLTLKSGELIFVIGGNGDGKTTLVKLLAGLYSADAGEILWNGEVVTTEKIDRYRQNFTVIFADFFLFDQLLGIEEWQIDEQAGHYLAQLQLDNKVEINGNRLSTTKLSYGQRKRLALLTAYLEDRPVYIFDEWAASQDPEFREVFYRQLLPELKQRGKLVIVISHDDHYFDVADRVIKLDFGKIIEE